MTRVPGVVAAVDRRIGDQVRAGDLLAVLDSREMADAKSEYLTAVRQENLARTTLNREAGLWKKKVSAEQDYLDARTAEWRGAGWTQEPGQTGYTGHDEDIGFATYGGDAVMGHIPRHHHDNTPAGLLGRLEMASMRRDPDRSRARVRSYVPKG